MESESSFGHLLQKYFSYSEIPQADLPETQLVSQLLAVFYWIYRFDKFELGLRERNLSLLVAHPHYLILIDLKVVRKGQSMINRNQICCFHCALRSRNQFFNYKDVGFVSVTVKDP